MLKSDRTRQRILDTAAQEFRQRGVIATGGFKRTWYEHMLAIERAHAGGGLFAATYRVQGSLEEPSVTVNPLAALTPGFLRGVFGLGQEGAPTTPR